MLSREIVIGGGLSAVLYAYCTDSVLLRSEDLGPPPFDFFEAGVDLSALSVEAKRFELYSNNDYKIVGASKRELWERLSFIKSICGGLPFSDKIVSIRVDRETKSLTVGGRGTSTDFQYDKLRIFGDKNVHGISDLQDFSEPDPEKYKVYDWFDVRSGCRHGFDYISTEDDFVRELFFYPSARVHGRHDDLKDVVSVSYLNRDQLHSVEYSDTYARLKVKQIMKDHGIRGTRNGRDAKNPEKFKYYALKLESSSRDICEVQKNSYHDSEDITFDYRTPEEILSQVAIIDSYSYNAHKRLVIQ